MSKKGHQNGSLDMPVDINWLNKKHYKRSIKLIKGKKKSLEKERDELIDKITKLKYTPTPSPDKTEEEIKHLKKKKKSLGKKIQHQKKKMKNVRKDMNTIDDRRRLGYEIDNMVNTEGLFRTNDTRYIDNGFFEQAIHYVGNMMNHAKPNYRKISSMVECIIGNLSMCNCDPSTIDIKMIEIMKLILHHKPVLECINPTAVVLYAKFLLLSRLDDTSIIFDCDQAAHSQKFSNAYRKISEGKYAFDQYVEFSRFQNKYMTPEQRFIFSQYQRIIRVMEDNGMVNCESGKLKQRSRNFIRDLGIRREQVGELLHYSYDKALDSARKYYAERDPSLDPVFGYIRDISNFSPSYAGERYAMASF